MRVDATMVQLRPRPMFEAVDLGVRLVQANVASLLRCALPVYAALVLLAFALTPLAGWAPVLLLWLAKPWLDRTLLFVLARALFRQSSHFSDLWAEGRHVWWQGVAGAFTLRRLSPWRSFTQPALQLEGLRGAALRKRRGQLRHGHQGAALAMMLAFSQVESALLLGLPALLLWLVPGGQMADGWLWLSGADTTLNNLLFTGLYALAVALVEPFFVGAGFGMYINRRVELEAWDVEQALRHAFSSR